MRERLIAANLWDQNDLNNPAESVSAAWRVVARVGAGCRYAGLSQDGLREFLLYDPRSGSMIASGRGRSTAEALCLAALTARQQVPAV